MSGRFSGGVSLYRAPLERSDSHVVLVEPVAVARECLGKDSDVVAYRFGDDIEVAASLGSRGHDFAAQPGDRSPELHLVDLGAFHPVEPPVHRAFQFGDGHAPARTTDHSIVAPAKTVPWGGGLQTRGMRMIRSDSARRCADSAITPAKRLAKDERRSAVASAEAVRRPEATNIEL